MKLVYYFIILNYISSFAVDNNTNKNKNLSDSKFVSSAFKDIDIENKLLASSKFDDCKKIYKDNPAKIDETLDCTKKAIAGLSASEAKDLLTKLNVDLTQSEGDSLTQKLAQYVTKKMKEALYGTNPPDPNKIPVTDQKTFVLIYERFLTRAIMLELSSYCLKKESENNKNIYSLKAVQNLDSDSQDKFIGCLKSLQDSCSKTSSTNTSTNTSNSTSTINDPNGCLLKNRFYAYKGVIKQLRENDKYWQEITTNFKDRKIWGFTATDEAKIKKKTDIELQNEISLISSTEIVDGVGGQTETDKLALEFSQKCNSGDKKACEEYAKFGSKESMGAVRIKKEMELDLKLKLVDDADKNKQSMEELAKKENLFSEEELKTKSMEDLKTALTEHFQNQKAALKETINKNMNNLGISKNDDLDKAKTAINNLHENFKNKPEELRAIFFYANLIQTRLDFQDSKTKKSKGTDYDAMKREIEKLKENKNQQPDPQLVDASIKYLEDKLSNAKRTIASSDENSRRTTDIDMIDAILNHEKHLTPNN